MAGTFRGHTFNALMQPNAVDDRPLAFRGTIAPLGTYANPDGTEDVGLAWPGMITEPLNALQRLHENSYTEDGRLGIPNPQHPENLQDASTALWSIYGGNALNPLAAGLGKGAVGNAISDHATAAYKAARHYGEPSALNLPDTAYWDKFGFEPRSASESPNAVAHYIANDGSIQMSYPDGWDSFGRIGGPNRLANDNVLGGRIGLHVADEGDIFFSDTGKPSIFGSAISSAGHDVSGSGAVTKPSGITAYHGSPHDFDKFDLSKIGTGEGAQAYGHGLYFAENEGVANSYRRKLSQGYSDGIGMAREALMLTGGDFEKAIAHVLRGKDSYGKRWGNDPNRLPFGKLYDDAVRELRLKPEGLAPSGHMYQVKINASPEDFLDWDLPLSQQSEKVNSLLSEHLKQQGIEIRPIGRHNDGTELIDVYQRGGGSFGVFPKDKVQSVLDNPAGYYPAKGSDIKSVGLTEDKLSEAGIPGIKYLDQMSRTAGDGSRNYVVFDDSLIEILKKYGLAGGAIGAGSLFDFNTDTQY